MNLIDDDVVRLRNYIETRASTADDSRLPPEPKLCEALGISRGRLRTVLKRLESEGLIWRHVGKGTFIGPRQIRADDASLSAAISLDDLLDARLVLEPQLAAQAAIHATAADIAVLEQCLSEMQTAKPFIQWKRLDERLHRAIAEATHNALLLMLYGTVRTQMQVNLDSRIEAVYSPMSEPRQDTDNEHRKLVDAIRAHNPDHAEQAMREHLRSVRTRLFGQR
ncbi:FadR/GntR family transcriptional regulator [Paraburkholderia sp. MM5384-R2]|uniref:FadR/GntR family transcriptional regulator n=1 Tax=Paraburkholderia sp. MM5384-R2 TaxID=2723097 RepID=UPI00160BF178|nr:FCD domain-containing protein [Paraburkholderia sp. MM5384-R2]MBB5497602.1 DNA-binding FadR family transcriptional regulator [Paraburkholderia sp. MM5384-R2]